MVHNRNITPLGSDFEKSSLNSRPKVTAALSSATLRLLHLLLLDFHLGYPLFSGALSARPVLLLPGGRLADAAAAASPLIRQGGRWPEAASQLGVLGWAVEGHQCLGSCSPKAVVRLVVVGFGSTDEQPHLALAQGPWQVLLRLQVLRVLA